jgi:hypothetical protein
MKRLIEVLPSDDEVEYSKVLARDGQDIRKIKGERSFNHLVTYISNEGATMERAADKAKLAKASDKQKPRTVHATMDDSDGIGSNNGNSNSHSSHAFQKKKDHKPKLSKQNRGWFNPSLKFPCPIFAHDHELASCAEFFSLPGGEKKRISGRKLCFSCLGPKEKCFKENTNEYKCINMHRAKSLICRGCVNIVKNHDIENPPYNMLLCQSDNHPKPTMAELSILLKAYMPEMDIDRISSTMVCVGSVVENSVNVMATKSKSSPVNNDVPEVVFDSSSGEKSILDNPNGIVNQQGGSVVYIMQWLQIGSSRCLCFFDTGANIHMIDGQMAERGQI